MKRTLYFLSALLLYPVASLQGQTVLDHPLNKTNLIVNDAEMVILHSTKTNSQSLVADFLDYDPKSSVNSRIKTKATSTFTTTGNSNMKSMNCISLDYNGDKFDDIVYVNQNKDKGITMTVPLLNRKTLQTLSSQKLTITNNAGAGYVPRFRLAKADFDRDGKEELILAFRDFSQEMTSIRIYSFDANGVPVEKASIADVRFGILSGSWEEDVYDITVNDFDGDSIPDIALANLLDAIPNNDFKMYTYKVNISGTWSITAKGSLVVGSGGSRSNYKVMALSSGYYNAKKPDQKQIALAVAYIDPADNNKIKRQLFIAETPSFKDQGANALGTLSLWNSVYSYSDNYNDLPCLNLRSGDLNQDFTDEIVFAYGPSFDIFSTDTNKQITKRANGGGGNSSNNFYHLATGYYIDIADVDKDFLQDVVIVSTYDDGNNFNYFIANIYCAKAVVSGNNPVVYNLNALDSKASTSTLLKGDYGGASDDYHFSIAFGDFDGGKGRLGAPTHMVKKILTPLVIVNTPPHHFDVFDGKVYDITDCFPNYQCQMNSRYEKAVSTSGTIETTFSSDWAVSSKISAGGNLGALGLSASLKATYGEEFSKSSSNTTTASVKNNAVSKGDDWIFADVTDYDIYEYPIDSNGIKIGYVLAKMRRPGGSMKTWMESKSPNAYYYIPDHEVGNVMSYPSFADFTKYAGGLQNIKGSPGASCDIGSTTNTDFTMSYADFASSKASTTTKFGIEAGASASIYGVSLETQGTYNSSDLKSHSSSASTEISFISNFTSTLNSTINPAPNYTLTPYVYWGTNGAITLGYSVDPSLPGQPLKTFWSEFYNQKPDLSMILPWRLDSAKGLVSTFSVDQPRLCKSIIVNKDNFITGDTARITAWIHNFSFKAFSGTAEFQFYLGPPNAGGTLLTDVNGQSTLSYTGNIPARGRVPIQFRWRIPAGLPSFPRIYVVIDPNNKIDEGHEDNNVGFNFMNSAGVTAKLFQAQGKDLAFKASLAPNPVHSEGTELQLHIPVEGILHVEVRDMSGKLVQKVYQSAQKTWAGDFIIPIPTRDLVQGMYVVNVHFNGASRSLKLMKLND